MHRRALVTDFDGTVPSRDFFDLIAERHMPPDAPDFLGLWREKKIRHWEAMQGYFYYCPTDEESLTCLLRDTAPDAALASCSKRLNEAGWDLIIVSAGSKWYIDRILDQLGVTATVHAIPGSIEAGRGLVLAPDRDAPFFNDDVGIDKPAVVADALTRYEDVAFAGDGRRLRGPDQCQRRSYRTGRRCA